MSDDEDTGADAVRPAPSRLTRRRALQIIAGGAAGALTTHWSVGVVQAQGSAAGSGAGSGESSNVDWERLRRSMRGTLAVRDDASYEAQRRAAVWNARLPERFPAAIARVANEDDVRTAIRFARASKLKVAVRGGGHDWNAVSLRQGTLMIDLSRFQEIRLDVARRTLSVQPALTGREIVELLTPHGLAFPVGHCSSVALSGYLLNGGFGWNSGAWGPACASVRAIDLIDARGERIEASAERHREYYWAARGAGSGFFGVVTRYHLDVHVLPAAIRTATLTFRARDAATVGKWLSSVIATLPPQVEVVCAIAPPPPEPPGAGSGTQPRKVLIVSATAFATSDAEADRWLAPFATPPAGATLMERTPPAASTFATLQRSMDGLLPPKHRYAADVAWSNSPLAELLPVVRDQTLAAPSSRSIALVAPLAPRPAGEPPPADMALSMFAQNYVALYGVWSDAAQDSGNRAWLRRAGTALEGHTVGRYVGEADLGAAPDRARQCYSPAAWEKLAELRHRFDPEGLFAGYGTNLG